MIAKVVNGEFVNLAGASSGGLPVGSILALHTNRVPSGYLPCNGATYDIAQYPALYTILQTNVLPDLREANLVGAGTNTTQSITTHDVYTIGQFKDDQVQEVVTGVETEVTEKEHRHSTSIINTMPIYCSAGPIYGIVPGTVAISCSSGTSCQLYYNESTGCWEAGTCGVTVDASLTCDSNSRTGSTTHGKNYGVFYVIKAVTGITELDDAEVYAQVVELLESNYIQKSLFSEGGIPMYNSTTECFDQITPPVCNGLALSYDVTNCCYCWGETASAVSNLTDVCLSNLTDGQYLQYDGTTCTWNNTTLTVDSTQIYTQATYGCAYACTWESNSNSCLKLFNGYDCEYSCIDIRHGSIKLNSDYSDNSPSSADVCISDNGYFCVSTNDSWSSGDYSSLANMCIDGHNVTFNTNADCCNGGCFVFNSTCNMCYDGNTGILYVHAICFI